MPLLQKKICLLGMFGVGKTSLVRRFVDDLFEEKYLSTMGLKISRKQIALTVDRSPAPLDLLIWDIASHDGMPLSTQNYFRGAHGALVVYDLTRPESAARLADYCEIFLKNAPAAKLLFAANKIDLVGAALPNIEQFKKLTGHFAAPHVLTSAKTGENVEAAFQMIAASLVVEDG